MAEKTVQTATGEEIAESMAQGYAAKDNAIGTIKALLAELNRRKQETPQEDE